MPETLTSTIIGTVTGKGGIKGTMAFERNEFCMDNGIPFINTADRVEVSVDLNRKRVSGLHWFLSNNLLCRRAAGTHA